MEEKKKRNWFSKHSDTIVILGSFAVCFWLLAEKINNVDKDLGKLSANVEKDLGNLRTDLAVIKTVLTLKQIMPAELACKEKKGE